MAFEIQHFLTSNPQTTHHFDTIHHVEFDFYGKRVATCSSDKVVCIWDRTSTGWILSAYWKKHGAAVWKARFAHPEYGQIFATCSLDNTIQIFDKDSTESNDQSSHTGFQMRWKEASNGWSKRATLAESTSNIIDIQFAPHYLGLHLAACTASGKVMIWDAEDIMALENWNNTFNLEVGPYRLSSLSWSTNRFNLPLIGVSSDDLSVPSNEKITIFMLIFNVGYGIYKVARQKFNFTEKVSCLSFGPSLGLTYHKLAIAVGTKIYVYNLQTQSDDGEQITALSLPTQRTVNNNSEFEIIKLSQAILGDSNVQMPLSEVIRISWNIMGDNISAVYANGIVRLWKHIISNKWILVTEIDPPDEFDSKRCVYY